MFYIGLIRNMIQMLVTFLWLGFFETEFLFSETGSLASDFLSQPEENPGAETRIQLVMT